MKAKKAISLVGPGRRDRAVRRRVRRQWLEQHSVEPGSGPCEPLAESKQPGSGGEAPSEAVSAATGDIPDNQVFLLFKEPKVGYSMRYPEGWARRGSGNDVTFQEKANVVHLTIAKGVPKADKHRRKSPPPE